MGSHLRPEILVITGETASGKSELAMKVAEGFDGEIVSADSWTVYKGFDIGTAKPSEENRRRVKHHLIDIVEPGEGFSAPKFKRLAEVAIEEIHSRGHLPIVVGGTGLYIDSLIFDYSFLPRNSEAERVRLNNLSISELTAEAGSKNIVLKGIDLRNKRRIVRAIEAGGQVPKKSALKKGVFIVGIKVERHELRRNIEKRVEQMFKAGLAEEVHRLSKLFGWEMEPMKGIGYREFKEYFEGKEALEKVKEKIISNTLNLAKKQRTWFKRNQSIHWFDSSTEAYKDISRKLNT